MRDVYYNPEQLELRSVAEINLSDGDYCFDLRAVWEHRASGILYTARDSGCSCPSPFEDYHSLEQLDMLDVEELVREIRAEGRQHRTAEECAAFLRTVRLAATRAEQAQRSRPRSGPPRQRVGWLECLEP
jgi:hypothetical protein